MWEDPALSPNAKRDPGYSLDKLRYEGAERYKEEAGRQRQIINLLDHIRGLSDRDSSPTSVYRLASKLGKEAIIRGYDKSYEATNRNYGEQYVEPCKDTGPTAPWRSRCFSY
jgi:hypothetical protein